jgi:hypothetical protein
VSAEIQLLACGYSAQCTVRGCRARATRLARYSDGQGRAASATGSMRSTHGLAQGKSPERPRFERRTRCLRKPSNAGCRICDAALASDDGPIFSTVAKLVDALKRSIPEGTRNAELKNEALRLARELLRGTKYEEE